jgi:hypothetical protein
MDLKPFSSNITTFEQDLKQEEIYWGAQEVHTRPGFPKGVLINI